MPWRNCCLTCGSAAGESLRKYLLHQGSEALAWTPKHICSEGSGSHTSLFTVFWGNFVPSFYLPPSFHSPSRPPAFQIILGFHDKQRNTELIVRMFPSIQMLWPPVPDAMAAPTAPTSVTSDADVWAACGEPQVGELG